MDIIKLLIVFAIVLVLVAMKKPLSLAVLIGSVATWLIYGIPVNEVAVLTLNALTSWSTLKVILVMYLITFLQRMMTKIGAIEDARLGLSRLFNSRWVNCIRAPIFIGMLPSPNAVFIAGDMVEATAKDFINKDQMAVTTTFFRHITEAFMPTYTGIILALTLTGYSAGSWVAAMIPMVIMLIVIGAIFFLLGKVPNATGEEPSKNKGRDAMQFIKGVWAIVLDVAIVLMGLDVVWATLIVLVLYFLVNKFKFEEVKPYFVSAFESRIVFNTMAVMVFKEILTATGVVAQLPEFFGQFPIPEFLIYGLIFFVGTLVAGSTTMIGVVLPIAMTSVAGAGMPLLVFLMTVGYIAMQVSPTHICLTICAEHFDVTLGSIIKQTIPVVITSFIAAIAYYFVLLAIL